MTVHTLVNHRLSRRHSCHVLRQMEEASMETPLRPMPLIVFSADHIDPATWPEGWPLEE